MDGVELGTQGPVLGELLQHDEHGDECGVLRHERIGVLIESHSAVVELGFGARSALVRLMRNGL